MPFDVNDAALREAFLRSEFPRAIAEVSESSRAQWGRMTPHQMVEHLIWALDCSTGRTTVECFTPGPDLDRFKRFLLSNRPSPREFMNPALATGLPALRFAGLEAAKAALREALERFLDGSHDRLHMHPVFGPLTHEEWHRIHYKHFHHHLEQFGLDPGGQVGRRADGQ
jgi:oxepin-CoA hydrolase/3-oxo-5,6-dehydrosuberyl-CoA semialdehyde dehydrogenase